METFAEFIAKMDNQDHQMQMEEVLKWVTMTFPQLKQEIKWNQPMFSDHGTFIIGFSVAKQHMAVAPENVAITHLEDEIKKAGFSYTKELIRMKWNNPVDYALLEKLIAFNISDKEDCSTFWRK